MKIHSDWRLNRRGVRRQEASHSLRTGQPTFSDTMQQQEERASQETLKRMLGDIEVQGDRLLKSMTLREMRQYKLMVRQFLEMTARRGVGLKETRGWDRRGRGRRYLLLEEIDKKLLEMTEELLENEQGKLTLLNHVGEIKGMLINFLF